jgi:hypothetical protein
MIISRWHSQSLESSPAAAGRQSGESHQGKIGRESRGADQDSGTHVPGARDRRRRRCEDQRGGGPDPRSALCPIPVEAGFGCGGFGAGVGARPRLYDGTRPMARRHCPTFWISTCRSISATIWQMAAPWRHRQAKSPGRTEPSARVSPKASSRWSGRFRRRWKRRCSGLTTARALTIGAAMIGGLAIARATAKSRPDLSDEIMAVRRVLGEVGGEGGSRGTRLSAPRRHHRGRRQVLADDDLLKVLDASEIAILADR